MTKKVASFFQKK